MAGRMGSPVTPSDSNEMIKLLWGAEVKEDVFRRWKQGLRFSADEPTALLQHEGGPCAVIAPVQAFILKTIVSELSCTSNTLQEISSELAGKLLVSALCDILLQAQSAKRFVLVYLGEPDISDLNPLASESEGEALVEKAMLSEHFYFHSRLRTLSLESRQDVENYYTQNLDTLKETYGVLLFLYSVLLTKGVEHLKLEVTDPNECFIDSEYGYGSQSLINLMITGRAVAHVWNYDQDLCGLKLKGIDKQSAVGFLTLLEHMRYCEVGSFLKNPMYPVWVLGSETHLTVLFSFEKKLVSAETPSEVARRVFKSFDPEGNNFIAADLLEDVLSLLDLVSDPEYVDIMKKKLDSESLGIILLSSFMDEFFPEEKSSVPDTFNLLHYNGLLRPPGKVVYSEGNAVLLESNLSSVLENDNMLTCLQTKWPSIEVQWINGQSPSLN